MADRPLSKDEALETLRILGRLGVPLWLAGGLAADFHVGRWTREHEEIDLVAVEGDRSALLEELVSLGFTQTDDRGRITRWTRTGRDLGEVSIAFMRRVAADTGDLVIQPEHETQGVVPGIYPGVPGNLDADRYGSVEGVRLRVISVEDEWVFATGYTAFRPGARPRPTVAHNLALLESLLTEEDRERLRPLAGRRLPLAGSVGGRRSVAERPPTGDKFDAR